MVAPVELGEAGVKLLIRNELLQEHEVRDRETSDSAPTRKISTEPTVTLISQVLASGISIY